MWRKYGFRCTRSDFHGALNAALSWHDTYLDWEERPTKESIDILHAVHNAATSLRAHLGKPGADKLLCVHHEDPAADPFMRVRHPTADARVLVALEARCEGWPAPAKRLRQDIRKASERLRVALSKCGFEELLKIYPDGAFPKPAALPSALDWLIQASAKAAKQIEDRTQQLNVMRCPRERQNQQGPLTDCLSGCSGNSSDRRTREKTTRSGGIPRTSNTPGRSMSSSRKSSRRQGYGSRADTLATW